MDAFDLKLLAMEMLRVIKISAADSMKEITRACYDLGRVSALVESGQISRYMSYNEATRPRSKGGYGRGTVDRWISEGLIEKIKDGKGNSKVRLDRLRLAELAANANRGRWFAFHDSENTSELENTDNSSSSSAKA